MSVHPVSFKAISRRLRAAAGVLFCLASPMAVACTASNSGTTDFVVDMKVTDRVLVLRGEPGWIRGCDPSIEHRVDISLQGLGLTPVSTTEYQGKTYVTYQLSPTSPLFFFPVTVQTSPGEFGAFEFFPAAEGTPLTVVSYADSSKELFAYPYLGVLRRAGMQSMPRTELGTEVIQHTTFPYSNRLSVSATVNVLLPTCTLGDTSFSLASIGADVLQSVGDASREQRFPVTMQCESAGIPVKLTLTDANDPTAAGSTLKPTANATAEGIRVELLRNGVPVDLGQQWDNGLSGNGAQEIALQARYVRIAGPFKLGEVEGQAVLTAEYR
ncbi:TPA: fimbrial protein [Stenotrophomonas maltophilia]